jgi:uncharacterized membrane-anchored protein
MKSPALIVFHELMAPAQEVCREALSILKKSIKKEIEPGEKAYRSKVFPARRKCKETIKQAELTLEREERAATLDYLRMKAIVDKMYDLETTIIMNTFAEARKKALARVFEDFGEDVTK